jgi:undecaprenyl phosphate-alpha-L-ara4N flippase subunit ArnF
MQQFDAGGHSIASLLASVSAGVNVSDLLFLVTGIVLYGLSMVCWVLALVRFEVSQAYPAMSVSYIAVYFGAILIPGLNESISLQSLLGIALIVAGVILIAQKDGGKSDKDKLVRNVAGQ